MSSNNNSNNPNVGSNSRRNHQPVYQNEITEDSNDIIDFDTGNEFSALYNRDIINQQQMRGVNIHHNTY